MAMSINQAFLSALWNLNSTPIHSFGMIHAKFTIVLMTVAIGSASLSICQDNAGLHFATSPHLFQEESKVPQCAWSVFAAEGALTSRILGLAPYRSHTICHASWIAPPPPPPPPPPGVLPLPWRASLFFLPRHSPLPLQTPSSRTCEGTLLFPFMILA